jgi:hypothetical protein
MSPPPVVQVRLTKQLYKDLSDLDQCAAECDTSRHRKTMERIAKNLRKQLGISAQKGGMAPFPGPEVYNISGSGLLNTSASPIDAGVAGAGLLNVPAPFTEGSVMGAGALFSPEAAPSYLPSSYAPVITQSGGKRKQKQSKSKSK